MPPIPPHATYEQIKELTSAVLKGDPNAWHLMYQGAKTKVQEFIPGSDRLELMSDPQLIVVGSGPAGVSAAEAFRQHDAATPVRIFTADPAPPYARPPLSKEFLRGETEDVYLHPTQWYTEQRIDVVHARVERIDPDGSVRHRRRPAPSVFCADPGDADRRPRPYRYPAASAPTSCAR